MTIFLPRFSNITVKLQKNRKTCAFFPLVYTANAMMNCAISPKPIRAAEELAKGTAETFLNGCEGDGKNGGEDLQSTYERRGRRPVYQSFRFIIM